MTAVILLEPFCQGQRTLLTLVLKPGFPCWLSCDGGPRLRPGQGPGRVDAGTPLGPSGAWVGGRTHRGGIVSAPATISDAEAL